MGKNSHIISSRNETSLKLKRSKVTKEKTDEWYHKFREFLEPNPRGYNPLSGCIDGSDIASLKKVGWTQLLFLNLLIILTSMLDRKGL